MTLTAREIITAWLLWAIGNVLSYLVPSQLSWLLIGAVPLYAWLSINGALFRGLPYGM